MSIEEKLHRARAYPYDSPRFSYLYHDGNIKDFDYEQTKGRIPVLAFGSNKAPSQLYRKFGHIKDQFIPVEQVRLHDFDVVFSAHITSYGAIPAMLQHCPDVVLSIAITWLDETQLDIMHKSELYAANYSFARLDDITLERDMGNDLTQIYAYIGERGHYTPSPSQKGAIAIHDIHAVNRKWESKTTADLLSHLHAALQPNTNEEDFILRLIDDMPYRRSVTTEISQYEHAFSYPYVIVKSDID